MGNTLAELRTELIRISFKSALSEKDALECGRIFDIVANSPDSTERKDCLFIITKRIWQMPIS
jgi:hypothetical protein